MVCVLVLVRTSDWTVPIAVIQTGDQIAIDLLNKTFCVHLLCTKGLVFLCNKPSCRNHACMNFYMKANVHRAVRRDDIYCTDRVGGAYSIYSNCFLNIKTRRKGEVYERNLSADKRGII